MQIVPACAGRMGPSGSDSEAKAGINQKPTERWVFGFCTERGPSVAKASKGEVAMPLEGPRSAWRED